MDRKIELLEGIYRIKNTEIVWELSDTLKKIDIWHRAWINQENMQTMRFAEIRKYMEGMNNENL